MKNIKKNIGALAVFVFFAAAGTAAAETIMNARMTGAEKNERACLAQNIYFESRNQSNRGQRAVGFVTINRVLSPYFPNSICAVVWQRFQFSWTNQGDPGSPKNTKAWKRTMMNANNVIDRHMNDVTKGATHYHADYVKPFWISGMGDGLTIGSHIFYPKN